MGIYRRSDSSTFWMSLQVDGKRVRMNTMVNDRRVAEDIFSAFKVEQAKARWLGIPPSDGDHTLQELIEEYLTKITPRKSSDSQRRDHGMLSKFSRQWGTLRLDEVTAKAIEDYMTKRLEAVSFATVSKELGLLKAVFHCARRGGAGCLTILSKTFCSTKRATSALVGF